MKAKLLMAPLCLFTLLVTYEARAQKVAAYMPVNPKLVRLEKDNGYQNAHFGADTTSFSDLEFETEVEDAGETTRTYHRLTDSKQFGQARINDISYNFQDGKLRSIIITFLGDENRKAALTKLTAMYGPGLKRPHSSLGDYWWSTEHVLLSLGDGLVGTFRGVEFSNRIALS